MQENEFEKQLKNLMGDLDLKPSDAVWEKVKRKLNDRNRKVLPFFFLLLAGLLVAGYFIYTPSTQQNKISENIINTNKNKEDKKATNLLKDTDKIIEQKKSTQTENKSAAKNQIPLDAEEYVLNAHKKETHVKKTTENFGINTDSIISKKTRPLQPIENNAQLQSPSQMQDNKTNTITADNKMPPQNSTTAKEKIINSEPSSVIIKHDVTENNNSDKSITKQDSANPVQNVFKTSHNTKTKKSHVNK